MKILGIIPARGGSKRLPKKNIRMLAGKPLIAWTIEEAKKSKLITCLIVSTEDSEVMEAAWKYGAEVLMREPELATDDASSEDVVRSVVRSLPGYDYVCLLQPTSPLRIAEDIDNTVGLAVQNGISVFTCNTDLTPRPNGAVYVWPSRDISKESVAWYSMPDSRSLDIDTEEEFQKAELALQAHSAAGRKTA